MAQYKLGIRGKLNVALAVLLLAATVAFGTFYASLERRALLDAKKDHLLHMAHLAELQLRHARTRTELDRAVAEFERHLSLSTGARHQLRVENERGEMLAESGPPLQRVPTEEIISDPDTPAEFYYSTPEALAVAVPVSRTLTQVEESGERPSRIVLLEPLASLRMVFRRSLVRHLAFAAALTALAVLAIGLICQRIVIRPVRELVAATEEFARGEDWEPIHPSFRRGDEIGTLADRLADMSRRLFETLRAERYGSAHLLALRACRELEMPLRNLATHLATLEKVVPGESEAGRKTAEMKSEIEGIQEIARRLGEVPATPAP